nr:MAG TPA: hypothetical protein [Caudoviricetes sp.]
MTLQLLLRLHRHSPHFSPLWGSTTDEYEYGTFNYDTAAFTKAA